MMRMEPSLITITQEDVIVLLSVSFYSQAVQESSKVIPKAASDKEKKMTAEERRERLMGIYSKN